MTVFCSHWDSSSEGCAQRLELSVSKALKLSRKVFYSAQTTKKIPLYNNNFASGQQISDY